MVSDLLAGLNPQQYEAVTAVEGPILVLAGPGSGKTGVLTRRVAYLIREARVKPYEIMAVTFTNKAAAEMRHRIEKFLGEPLRGLQMGTFHSTCARILRIEHESIPYNQDYVIYDTDDQLTALGQALSELNIDPKKFTPRRILSAISSAKNEVISPRDFTATDYFGEIVERVYPRYQSLLIDSNAMDFDDLLMQMVLLLRENEVVRDKYQKRFPFVMVDEFQDTNTVQYQLVQLLGMPQNNIFVVGDEDQSIYAFRGADFRNVLRFRHDYPDARVILLEQNYRSTQVVLDVARAVIDKNTNRTRKALFTTGAQGEPVTVKEAYDEQYEAQYIMETIETLMKRKKYKYSDFAVMYRTNAQSRALEASCRNYNIPYRLVGGIGFYQRREIKDLLAYLRVINNPDDKISFARIVNVPKRGIGDKSVQNFSAWAASENLSYSQALQMLVDGTATSLTTRIRSLLTGFATQLFKWRSMIETGRLAQLFDSITSEIGYNLYLLEISDSDQQAQERAENVQELRGLLSRYDEENVSLSEFLQEQQLMTDEDRATDEETNDKVTLLTLHAAKGLEYPVVFITGLEEGLLPHQRAFEEADGLEEERRLFYVGITRAKERLYVTYAHRRALYGNYGELSSKSAFLFDIPQSLLSSDSSISYEADDAAYKRMTTWDSKPAGLNRLADDLRAQQNKPGELSRLQEDLRAQSKPKGHISDEGIRGKILPFPGGTAGGDPLKFRAGMLVEHASFGKGKVVMSKRKDGAEIVTVAFEDKRFGLKDLDIEFAHMTILK
jgi:DNA helicase II / ATP-dependent DNA helicase PcrA